MTEDSKRVRHFSLFRPFEYLNSWQAFSVGLVAIVVAAGANAVSGMHFGSVLGVPTGACRPAWFHVAEGCIAWLALVVPLYLAGSVLSESRVGLGVLVSTQAFARAPAAFSALLGILPGYQRMTAMAGGELPRFAAESGNPTNFLLAMFAAAGMMAMHAWMILLMYRSYRFAAKFPRGRAIASFVIVLLLAQFTSKVIIHALAANL